MGITQALALAEGRSVVVCAVDLPFVTPELIYRLATADLGRSPAVVACRGDDVQPLLGCYAPRAIDLLRSGAAAPRPRSASWSRRSGRGCSRSATPSCCSTSTLPEDLLHAAAMPRRSRPGAAGHLLAEREVVGADARRQLDGDHVLLRPGAARPASTAAGRERSPRRRGRRAPALRGWDRMSVEQHAHRARDVARRGQSPGTRGRPARRPRRSRLADAASRTGR